MRKMELRYPPFKSSAAPITSPPEEWQMATSQLLIGDGKGTMPDPPRADTGRVPGGQISVVIGEERRLVLAGLKSFLRSENIAEVVGEAGTADSLAKLIEARHPQVVIIGRLRSSSLPSLIRRIRDASASDRIRILALADGDADTNLNEYIRSGSDGILLENSVEAKLLDAITAVSIGGFYLDPAIPRGQKTGEWAPEPSVSLSDRELAALTLFAAGFAVKEIASRLGISPTTAQTYKDRAATKLGLKTRSEIIRYVSRWNGAPFAKVGS